MNILGRISAINTLAVCYIYSAEVISVTSTFLTIDLASKKSSDYNFSQIFGLKYMFRFSQLWFATLDLAPLPFGLGSFFNVSLLSLYIGLMKMVTMFHVGIFASHLKFLKYIFALKDHINPLCFFSPKKNRSQGEGHTEVESDK